MFKPYPYCFEINTFINFEKSCQKVPFTISNISAPQSFTQKLCQESPEARFKATDVLTLPFIFIFSMAQKKIFFTFFLIKIK